MDPSGAWAAECKATKNISEACQIWNPRRGRRRISEEKKERTRSFIRLEVRKQLQTCEQSRDCVKESEGEQQPHSSRSPDEHIRGGQFFGKVQGGARDFGCVDFDFGCFCVDCDLETHGPIFLPVYDDSDPPGFQVSIIICRCAETMAS